jgi:uncharacterized Tic20 family protein
MSETPTPPGSSEPEPPAAPQYDAPAPPPPPAGGYTAPPVTGQVAPVGYANNDEKTWALIAHFGAIVGVLFGGIFGWVAPLIAMLVKGNESATVRAHSVSALNFQITWAIAGVIAYIIGIVTCGIGFAIVWVVWVVPIVFAIIGGVKANEGVLYKYPMSIELIK